MEQDVVLVTGASSGIGAALARRIARDNRALVLVARRAERLERLAADLRGQHGVEVHVVARDLLQPGAGVALAEELARRELAVHWLVNNAGFGTVGRFHELPVARELDEIRLNVAVPVELAGAFLPAMVRRGRGAVVNVASVAAFGPMAGNATYAATKAFLLSWSESLAAELRGTGVSVTCVCPGFTRTEFQETAHVDVSIVPSFAWMTADQVADQAVAAVGRRTVVVNGTMNGLMAAAMRVVPRSFVARLGGAMLRSR